MWHVVIDKLRYFQLEYSWNSRCWSSLILFLRWYRLCLFIHSTICLLLHITTFKAFIAVLLLLWWLFAFILSLSCVIICFLYSFSQFLLYFITFIITFSISFVFLLVGLILLTWLLNFRFAIILFWFSQPFTGNSVLFLRHMGQCFALKHIKHKVLGIWIMHFNYLT